MILKRTLWRNNIVMMTKSSVLLFSISFLLFLSSFHVHGVNGNGSDFGKYFKRTPQSIVAPPGDRVTFQCETNIPPERVRWKLNGRFLDPNNETDIRVGGSFLVVKVGKVVDRYMQQVGDYQCVADFGAESLTSLPAQLTIAKLDQFPPHPNKTLEVMEGNSLAIFCDPPYSNPSPVLQFWKDGKPLESETGESIVTADSGFLHMYNVTQSDSGLYWCAASNHITTETYPAPWYTRVVVSPKSKGGRKPPEFLLKPKSLFVVPKDGNVSLECVAVGNPPPFVTWRKLRSPLSSNHYKSVHGTLHLYNVNVAHEGEYVCEAYNGVGEALTSMTSIVLNSMPNITKAPVNQVVEEGGELMLDCGTEGLPKPRVYWVFNGYNVINDGNVQSLEWGLRISQVEKRHAGLFQCFAVNPMGSVYAPVEVRVLPKQFTKMASDASQSQVRISRTDGVLPPTAILKEDLDDDDNDGENLHHSHPHAHHQHKLNKFHRGKHNKRKKHKGQEMTPPSKPVINRVSDDSVMVRWTVPPNNGYPIQFFKIQYKEMGKRSSRWMTIDDDIPPHIHSYEVRDLKVGHAYRFRIAAVYSNNDNKVGPNSEKFVLQKEMTMRRPMFAPVITNALPFNNSAILLRWKHMKPETGIDGYFVYYRETTSATEYSKITVLGQDTESAYISFLKIGISYDIKIQSFNRAGASGFSSIVSARTTGQPSTEKPHPDLAEKEKDLLPDDELPQNSDHLYIVFGCLFIGFWILLCVSCALCYKCKQRRAEEEAKYSHQDPDLDVDKGLSPDFMNGGHLHNGHINSYIPTITSHLDEKETSFVERFNNNRPISPSHLNTHSSVSSFKATASTLERDTELTIMTKLRKESIVDARNCNSLHRKKNQINSLNHNNPHHHHHHHHHHTGSLKKLPYVSCSSEDLDSEDTRGSRIFPKEHYRVSRKHNKRKSGSGGD